MRRQLGVLLYVGGGLLFSFAGGRYVQGVWRAESARRAWDQAEAKVAVMRAQNLAVRAGVPTRIAAGVPVAQIVIRRIGLDEIALEGVTDEALNAGPGHLPGSAIPGEPGNAIFSAHRDRHFARLDLVQVGDTVVTDTGHERLQWIVISRRVVGKDTPALFSTPTPTLTLTTCWPVRYMGPAPERLIVTARPIAPARHAVVAGAVPPGA